ncbi:hypothetical protein PENTCL1PPCAC_15779, partial [Pristionchus entomophagus]
LPASVILQWISLAKRDYNPFTKVVLAYSAPLVFNIISWYSMSKLVPTEDFRERASTIITRLHGTNRNDFRIYGVPIFDNETFDGIDLAVFDLLPSFFASNILFAISAYKIHAELRSIGKAISTKTQLMQRRFFHTQIAQV